MTEATILVLLKILEIGMTDGVPALIRIFQRVQLVDTPTAEEIEALRTKTSALTESDFEVKGG